MSTLQLELVRQVAGSGLIALRLAGFFAGPDGVWRYPGERPGPGWHAHGSFLADHGDLGRTRLVWFRVAKPRWLLPDTNETVHTPPPGDLGARYSGLVVALQLFAWLDAAVGLHAFEALFDDLADRPCRRTVQRWLARLRPYAPEMEHHARVAILNRHDKPRSLDMPGGIPPPGPRRPGPWRDPVDVWRLHRALVMVLGAAVALSTPTALLVTEAWWRVEHKGRRENG